MKTNLVLRNRKIYVGLNPLEYGEQRIYAAISPQGGVSLHYYYDGALTRLNLRTCNPEEIGLWTTKIASQLAEDYPDGFIAKDS